MSKVVCIYCSRKLRAGQPGLPCDRCATMVYCDKECRRKHRPHHRDLCDAVEDLVDLMFHELIGSAGSSRFLLYLGLLRYLVFLSAPDLVRHSAVVVERRHLRRMVRWNASERRSRLCRITMDNVLDHVKMVRVPTGSGCDPARQLDVVWARGNGGAEVQYQRVTFPFHEIVRRDKGEVARARDRWRAQLEQCVAQLKDNGSSGMGQYIQFIKHDV